MIIFNNKLENFCCHYKNLRFLYPQKHHFISIYVINKKRSAQFKAAVRLKTWNGVLSAIGKSNDCSYLQRQRVSSTERSYSKKKL